MRKFTLIELLLVIAIITILTTQRLPSLSNTRLKARQAICLTNQHQMAIVIFSYILDYKGWDPTDNIGSGNNWVERITPTYIPEKLPIPDGLDVSNKGKRATTISLYVFVSDRNLSEDNPIAQKNSKTATTQETASLIDSDKDWRSSRHSHMKPSRLYEGPLAENIAPA